MKKIINSILLLIFLGACTGYKPIFSSTNLQFKVNDYLIEGDKTLGNKIYSKLNRLSKSNKNSDNIPSFNFLIDVSKNKISSAKDKTVKITSYKINLIAKIEVKDSLTKTIIVNQTFRSSTSYSVQDRISETAKVEK